MADVGKLDSGPIDLSTGASLPRITEVQRLTVKPGDVLVVRTDEKLSHETATALRERLHSWLGLPDDVRVLILDRGASIEVMEGHV